MSVIVDLPDIRPSLLLDFANSRRVHPLIQCTRASTATCFGPDGKIKTVPANVPRIDHDPATGKCLGLLVEEARTNLALFSGSIRVVSGVWTATRCALSFDDGVAPPAGLAGIAQVTKMLPDGTGSAYFSLLIGNAAEGVGISASVLLKSGGTSKAHIDFITAAGFSNIRCSLNFADGSFVSGGIGSAKVEKLQDGWFRVQAYGASSNGAIQSFRITTNTDSSVAGANALLVTAAQVELGGFPTSYIHTTSAAVTRAADLLSMDFTMPTTGAIVSSVAGLSSSSTSNAYVWSAINPADNSADHSYFYYPGGTQSTNWWINKGGVGQSGGNILGRRQNAAISFDASAKTAAIASGSLFFQDESTRPRGFPGNLSQLFLGRSHANAGFLNGCISRFAVYSGRITNAQLQRLTA